MNLKKFFLMYMELSGTQQKLLPGPGTEQLTKFFHRCHMLRLIF